MIHLVAQKTGNFLTSWRPVSFSVRTLLHVVVEVVVVVVVVYHCSHPFFHEGTPSCVNENNSLLQYCQLPDKNSRDISRIFLQRNFIYKTYINARYGTQNFEKYLEFFAILAMFYLFVPLFLAEPGLWCTVLKTEVRFSPAPDNGNIAWFRNQT
jgi:hypothetical protein